MPNDSEGSNADKVSWAAYKKSEKQQECIDSGGWINEYDCGEHGCAKWTCVKS